MTKNIGMEVLWTIENMPFIWDVSMGHKNYDIPEQFPFILGSDLELGRLVQIPTPSLSRHLEIAYNESAKVAGMMDDETAGVSYATDFLGFMMSKLETLDLSGKKVLDIGCGPGYLLSLLKEKGAEVLGIEPGQTGQCGAEKYGVPIIQANFSPDLLTEQFDTIIFTLVLEHFEDPVDFLKDVKQVLKPDGTIFMSVPNCEPYIRMGDVSTLFHEHFSYFTALSLENTLSSVGLSSEIIPGSYGNTLYAKVVRADVDRNLVNAEKADQSLQDNLQFVEKAKGFVHAVEQYIAEVMENGKTLGIYVPIRIVNVLAMLDLDCSRIRFFDDDAVLYGGKLPGFDIPIQNRKDLFEEPTDHILIASISFGKRILENIMALSEQSVKITCLDELLVK